MVKIGIILFNNIKYAPYLSLYLKAISEIENANYDVIYFDRNKILAEKMKSNHIPISWFNNNKQSMVLNKIINFLAFRFRVTRILQKNKYDFIIVLTSIPMVILGKYILKHYHRKFIYDIRDYTHEHIKLFYASMKKAVENSCLNIISSDSFQSFLPPGEYIKCHNKDMGASTFGKQKCFFKKAIDRPIIIGYIGSIAYEKQCKQLIDLVVKDTRFEFHFYGNEAPGIHLSKYVSLINSECIKMFGPYSAAEKQSIYQKCDLVFNCYGNTTPLVKYAISNKYYDGAYYQRPLLVSPNTTMADISNKFAYPLDLENIQSLDSLYNWYMCIDESEYVEYTATVIESAMQENLYAIDLIKASIIGQMGEFSD